MSDAAAPAEPVTEVMPTPTPGPPGPRRGALVLALLSAAVLGAAGGHAWASRSHERVHASQLGRLARDELKATIDTGRYADVPLVLQRYHESTLVVSVAWTDHGGGVRAMAGEPRDFGPPPKQPAVVDGTNRVAWADLPEGDWLRLELESVAPPAWLPALALAGLLLGLAGLRPRR